MTDFLKRACGMKNGDEEQTTELSINRINFYIFLCTYCLAAILFLNEQHVAGRSQIAFIIIYSCVPLLTHLRKRLLAASTICGSLLMQIIISLLLIL